MLDYTPYLQGKVPCHARSESERASGQAAPTAPLREIATLDAAISRWESEGGAAEPKPRDCRPIILP